MEALVSIVIINFNYSAYLASAVRSALNQSYRRIEIIVVDDGSTDDSALVLAEFGSRVHGIHHQRNQGPNSARNSGYASTSGDIVFFLDADDALHPRAAEEVVRRWRSGLSKVQFCLSTINADGQALNIVSRFPDDYSPERVRSSVLCTGSYVWPVQAGNAYGRDFLDRVMPISTTRFPTALDGPLNTIAPLFGDVISIEKVLGYYRVHGRNLRAAQQFDAAKFVTLVQMKGEELAFLREWSSKLSVRLAIDPCHEASFVEHRIAAARLDLHWRPGRKDKIMALVAVAAKNIVRSEESFLRRMLRLLVTLATAAAPKPIARRIVELRFVPMSRPHALAAALRFTRAGRLTLGRTESRDLSDMARR